jgi:lysophospholipase L1-like esterase
MKAARFSKLIVAAVIALTLTAAVAKEPRPNPLVVPTPYSHPAVPKRLDAMRAQVKQGKVDLIFLGDSITYSWQEEGKGIWKQLYAPRHAVNLGLSGDRTGWMLWRMDDGCLDGISPKLVVLLIGTNSSAEQPAEYVADGIKAVVEKLRAKLPETKVLVMGIFPRGDKKNRQEEIVKINAIISRLADDKMVFYMDIGAKFLNPDGTVNDNVRPDKLHLTTKGYETWAEAIEPLVEKLMGEQQPSKSPATAKKAA